MTFATAQKCRQFGDTKPALFLKLSDVHARKFGYSELTVKRKVRNSRNDSSRSFPQSLGMSKLRKREKTWFVKEWLERKNLRQKDLVSRTDWNKSQVNEWVNEKERWNRDVLYGFAFAIGVEPADLLKPPPPPPDSNPVENELAKLIVEMDQRQKERTLRLLRAMADESKAA